MRYLAARISAGTEASEDFLPLSRAPYAIAVVVNEQPVAVTIIDPPPREVHSGACACEACRSTKLADLAIKFY
jgi:hypothetical protein